MDNFLQNTSLFSSLATDELNIITKHMIQKQYAKNEVILNQGDDGDCLFIISEGAVKVSQISESGKEIALAILYPGDSFGEMSLFDDEKRSATLTSIKKTDVFMLTRKALFDSITKLPALAIKLLQVLSRKLRQINGHIEFMAFATLKQRIAKFIIANYEKEKPQTKEYVFPFSHKEIADFLGVSRESVSRTFIDLKNETITESNGRQIIIKDIGKIRDIIK